MRSTRIFFRKIVLVPDIVMSMKRLESLEIERSGIVLCFRQDKEDSMDSNYKAELIARVESIFDVKKKRYTCWRNSKFESII